MNTIGFWAVRNKYLMNILIQFKVYSSAALTSLCKACQQTKGVHFSPRGLETSSDVFMTFSCSASWTLLVAGEKKTCFAASVSGLWCVLRADGQVFSYLHPVSTAAVPPATWRGNDLMGYCCNHELGVFWPPTLFFLPRQLLCTKVSAKYLEMQFSVEQELFSWILLLMEAHSDSNS